MPIVELQFPAKTIRKWNSGVRGWAIIPYAHSTMDYPSLSLKQDVIDLAFSSELQPSRSMSMKKYSREQKENQSMYSKKSRKKQKEKCCRTLWRKNATNAITKPQIIFTCFSTRECIILTQSSIVQNVIILMFIQIDWGSILNKSTWESKGKEKVEVINVNNVNWPSIEVTP